MWNTGKTLCVVFHSLRLFLHQANSRDEVSWLCLFKGLRDCFALMCLILMRGCRVGAKRPSVFRREMLFYSNSTSNDTKTNWAMQRLLLYNTALRARYPLSLSFMKSSLHNKGSSSVSKPVQPLSVVRKDTKLLLSYFTSGVVYLAENRRGSLLSESLHLKACLSSVSFIDLFVLCPVWGDRSVV